MMATAKAYRMTPDEEFLAAALKDGRAKIEELSMKAIGKPDRSIQCRVLADGIDPEHVRRLSAIHDSTGTIAPIVVFRDPVTDRLLIADGFHRHRMHEIKKLSSIAAYVVEGGRRDAVEFAAMCNRHLCLARTMADIRKAVMVLLEEESWLLSSAPRIAQHVGCSESSVLRYRGEFCSQRGIPVPTSVVTADGKAQRRRRRRAGEAPPRIYTERHPHSRPSYRTRIGGKVFNLGRDAEAAEEKAARIRDDIEESIPRNARIVAARLRRRGIGPVDLPPAGEDWHGLGHVFASGHIIVPCPPGDVENFPYAYGVALMVRAMRHAKAHLVILCRRDLIPPEQAAQARRVGIELLLPGELVERLGKSRTRE
jgi:hypothetical protein